jgi:hypothetical protein
LLTKAMINTMRNQVLVANRSMTSLGSAKLMIAEAQTVWVII